MDDKIFKIDLERSRIYWDYYRSMYLAFVLCMAAGMVAAAVIYTKGELALTLAAGVILLLFLCVILLSAVLSLMIWRHESRHFDELIREEERDIAEKPQGRPLV